MPQRCGTLMPSTTQGVAGPRCFTREPGSAARVVVAWLAMATPNAADDSSDVLDQQAMLSPFKEFEWRALTPAERLERAWALRKRLVRPEAAHDSKLFPAP